jgi:hypothetical protein
MEKTMNLKGVCENCGFAYMGTVISTDGAIPEIKCPSCHKVTDNNDEAYAVDALNRAEGDTPDYKASELELAK